MEVDTNPPSPEEAAPLDIAAVEILSSVDQNVEIQFDGNQTSSEPMDTKQIDQDNQPAIETSSTASNKTQSSDINQNNRSKKSVLFKSVKIYFFSRSQGFTSIPAQGGSTLGMNRKHFLAREMPVDLFEEVRRRSRREILLKIKLEKERIKTEELQQLHCNSASSSASNSNTGTSESDDDDDNSYSEYSDISDSELETESFIFLQPINVKLRRSLLRASGVGRIDPKEKKECKFIRDSRERSGCRCVNQCMPSLCECSLLGVNCHVDRVSYPCGCNSSGCQNPSGRTEFDVKQVNGHRYEKLGVG